MTTVGTHKDHLSAFIQYDLPADTGDAEEAISGPQNKHIRIENKNFYFDIKRNQQGRYMSISEVKGNYRNSILVPESGWESFRDVLDEYVKQVKTLKTKHLRNIIHKECFCRSMILSKVADDSRCGQKYQYIVF